MAIASALGDLRSPQGGIALRTAAKDRAEQIQAIGLSGQMHGVVLADVDSVPLRAAI